ncbi:type I pullulanase [Paenibacillus apiarius]|uniref:type I pullulanase n=1 Tax=Paenibacillus apiarius TaxID=46240 RepID=UPI00197E9D5B|nr:type I pullulanase [Paenibacillus apiarius]MBN3525029.1 type I pullulanase [Paenibacillus apiarius]
MRRTWKAAISRVLAGVMLAGMLQGTFGGEVNASTPLLDQRDQPFQDRQEQSQTLENNQFEGLRQAETNLTAEAALQAIDWSMVKSLGTSPAAGWQGFKLDQVKLANDGSYLYFRVDAAKAEQWQYIDIALLVNGADSGISGNPMNRQFTYDGTAAKPKYHIVMDAKTGGEAAVYESGSKTPLLSTGDLKGSYFEAAANASILKGAIPLQQLRLKNGDELQTIVVLSGDRADEHGAFDVIPETPDNAIADDWNMKENPSRQSSYSQAYTISYSPIIDGEKDALWSEVPDLGISVTDSTYGAPSKLGGVKLTNDSKKLYVWVDAEVPNWGEKGQFIDIALHVNEADSGISDNPWGYPYNFSGTQQKPQYHIMMRVQHDNGINGAALYDSMDMRTPILSSWTGQMGAEFAANGKSGFEAAIPLHLLKLKNGDRLRPLVVLSGNQDAEHGAFNVIPEAAGNARAASWNEAAAPNVQSEYGGAYVVERMNDKLELISTEPAEHHMQADVDQPIVMTYSEPIAVNGAGITLTDDKGATIQAAVTSSAQQLMIVPAQPLAYEAEYTVTVPADVLTGLETTTANKAYSFAFKTKAQPSMRAAIADQDNEILVTLNDVVRDLDYTAFAVYNGAVKLNGKSEKGEDDKSVVIRLTDPIGDVSDPYAVRYEGNQQGIYRDRPLTMRGILDSYVYTGDDLGVTFGPEASTFKVWAPTVAEATLALYDTAELAKETPSRELPLERDADTGVWSVAASGNLNGAYYMYKLRFPDGTLTYALDPYARSSSVNSGKSAVVDLAATNPSNWEAEMKPPFLQPTDAVIYELHMRDFSISSDSGVSAANQGKFTAFTETGTTLPGKPGIKTGISHLKELGVTHVHLLPAYDFGSINERKVDDPASAERKFNWGYDPVNYNVPEGSYATASAQEDPAKRIREFKAMVQGLHDQGIRVVLDVVYNHTFVTGMESDLSVFDKLVPGYYYRTDAQGALTNGSGVGNEVATERPMVSKYVRDSVKYWAEQYNVDGFRFDLMKLVDLNTTRGIMSDLKAIDPSIIVYGEPWAGGNTPLASELQIEKGKQRGEGFAVFNDNFRGAIKGGSDDASKGFATGAAGQEAGIVKGVLGATTDFTAAPTETINYVTAHDNLNLWDKVLKTQGKDADIKTNPFATLTERNVLDNETVKRSLLANGMVLTAQGIPFLHAGDELLRSKFGDHNSYQSPDAINQIVWKQKDEYKPVFDYLKGLIELRTSHPAFRMTTKEAVAANLELYRQDGQIVAFKLKNYANGDKWRNIAVIYNGADVDQDVALPSNEPWNVVVDHTAAGVETIRTVQGGKVKVAGLSMMVLYDQADEYTQVPSKLEAEPQEIGLEPGASKQLTAVVKDQNNRPMPQEKVTWTTSDASIAIVSGMGKVAAVTEGTAVLTATAGKLQAEVTVTVAKLEPATLDIYGAEQIYLGRTVPFTAVVKDQFGQTMSGASVRWSSSDPAVARVDRAGKVSGVQEGTTTITAQAGSVQASQKVAVKPLLKRYVQINYVRPDAKYDKWGLWVWQTGVQDDGHEFQRYENGMATAMIEIGPETESIGFIIKKGDWEEKDTDSDRFIRTNLNDTLTKVYVHSGQTAFRTLPSVTGPVLDEGNITFYYRDDALFESGEAERITKVEIVVNGITYPMMYDRDNERYVYTLQDAATGVYEYKFLVTKDGSTKELADPKNTVNGRSIVNYKKPEIAIDAAIEGGPIYAGLHRILNIRYESIDKVGVRGIIADLSALGGSAATSVDTELLAHSFTVRDAIEPGIKEIPITLIDEFGNRHKSSAQAEVVAKPASTGKLGFDWDEARIYFVLTDRFYDGDPSNNGTTGQGYDKHHLEAYHGGDFRGLIDKLDYIEQLGVNTLWITPIVENIDFNQGASFNGKQYAYHGYWGKNFEKIDKHLGDVDTFKELIEKAHDRGIKIMVDVVLNHTGYGLKPDDRSPGITEEDKQRFAGMLRSDGVSADTNPVRGELAGLPDFMTELPHVRDTVINWQAGWLERARTDRGDTIDYFRVDTVKHVDDTTWKAFRNKLTELNPEFKLIGEYFGASVDNTGSYLRTGEMDSLLDFDFKSKARDFVNGKLDATEAALQDRETRMDNTAMLGQFLSSHDEDGFLSHYVGGDKGKLMVAAALQITAKGQPVVYYGEELGRSGANARDMSQGQLSENRGDMPWDKLDSEKKLHDHYSKLLHIRAAHSKAFSKGERTKLAGGDADGYMIFAKSYQNDTVIVGLNPKAEAKEKVTFRVPYAPDTKVTDEYSGAVYVVSAGQTVTVHIPSKDDGGTIVLAAEKKDTGTKPDTGAENGGNEGTSSGGTGGANGTASTLGTESGDDGFTVTADGVRYEPSTIAKVTNADGTVTAEVRISAVSVRAMLNLLGKAQNKHMWTIAVPDESADVRIVWPMNVLKNAVQEHPQLDIIVKTGAGSYQLPLARVMKQANGDAATNLTLHIKQLSGEQLKPMQAAASYLTGSSVPSAAQFQLGREANGKLEALDKAIGSFTARSITVPGQHARIAAVKYNEATKNFSFVPSQIDLSADGKQTIVTMKHQGDGIYAALVYAPAFEDLSGHWAKADLELLASKLIVNGKEHGRFVPNESVTRAEFAAMLIRALGFGDQLGQNRLQQGRQASFTDVSTSAWFADTIALSVELKLVRGYADGTFKPNEPITREQMAQMLVNAAALTELKQLGADNEAAAASFKDSKQVGAWARKAVDSVAASGLMNGFADKTLRPGAKATRAEAGSLLKRLLLQLDYIAE